MIVGMPLNSDNGDEGGLGPDKWADIAARFDAPGLIDYISLSHGTYINRMHIYPTSPEAHGFQLDATARVKAALAFAVKVSGSRVPVVLAISRIGSAWNIAPGRAASARERGIRAASCGARSGPEDWF